MKTIAVIAALFTVAISSAHAEQGGSRADRREARQDARIEQGVQSGQLTEKEAAKLQKGQAHVDRLEDKAMADGTVTEKESKRIEHAQDVQSRRIAREKHDGQRDLNHDGKNDRRERRAK